MINLSFDIVDPFPVLSAHELISESGINDQDMIWFKSFISSESSL